ncbi:MAG: EVE domain-containing protein [Planctomycetota bacterium]
MARTPARRTPAGKAAAPGRPEARASVRRYWLFKSEPDVYGWAHLERDGRTFWDGVRNYQARNLLRDEIRPGDGVLFYHSNADPTAVVGVARVVEAGAPDPSAFDPDSAYHDPDSSPDDPRWFGVEIAPVQGFARPVTRDDLKACAALGQMMVLRRGARLSVQPVTAAEWRAVLKLAGASVDW